MPIVSHTYWAFTCINKKCAEQYIYAYLGEAGKFTPKDAPTQLPFPFHCPNCGTHHIYTQLDLYYYYRSHSPLLGERYIGEL